MRKEMPLFLAPWHQLNNHNTNLHPLRFDLVLERTLIETHASTVASIRLLDAKALIYDNVARLKDFPDADNASPYAILSYTWEHEEILFQDIALGPQHEVTDEDEGEEKNVYDSKDDSNSDDSNSDDSTFDNHGSTTSTASLETGCHIKAGWNKVLNTCLLTVRDGMRFVWIDTCCIDKSSSAELSEAINSMFEWYQKTSRCYAYLNDCRRPPDQSWKVVPEVVKTMDNKDMRHFELLKWLCVCNSRTDESETSSDNNSMLKLLQDRRWFARGWTLQELIAPEQLWFFDRDWRFLVEREEILSVLERITGVHKRVFWRSMGRLSRAFELSQFSVAQRMHWPSSRRTSRKEDEAYCLLGIFGINMPLLCGEGNQAFKRLQEEILKTTSDHSILAWEFPKYTGSLDHNSNGSLLAGSPSYLRGAARYIAPICRDPPNSGANSLQQDMYLTRHGLHIELSIDEYLFEHREVATQTAVLECVYDESGGHSHTVGLLLQTEDLDPKLWQSVPFQTLITRIRRGVLSTVETSDELRRLIKLPLWFGRTPLPKRPLLISTKPGETDLSPPGGRVCMEFLEHLPVQSEDWHILATYPRSRWSETWTTLGSRDAADSYRGMAVSDREHGTIFIIIGFSRTPSNNDNRAIKWTVQRRRYFWIVKDIQIDPKTQEHPFRVSLSG